MSKQALKVLYACMLGDGYTSKPINRSCRFSIKQRHDHRDHLEYLEDQLNHLTTFHWREIPAQEYTIRDKPVKSQKLFEIRSKYHPIFTEVRYKAYMDGHKVVDPHMLTFMDAEFLAIWFQQDGYMHRIRDSKNPTPGVVLCTDRFSYADHELLRRAIIERTGFIFNIQRFAKSKAGHQMYRLHMTRKQTDQFFEFVRPYIQPSFMYKITR